MDRDQIRLPLTDGPLCEDGPGAYIASAYYATNSVQRREYVLGMEAPDDDEALFGEVNARVRDRLGDKRYSAAAIQVLRFCLNPHEGDQGITGPRVELGYDLVATGGPRIPAESTPSGHHFGNVSRFGSDYERRIKPLVLPARAGAPTPVELMPVDQAGSYIYVALRGTEQLISQQRAAGARVQ
jgi:hypothetical protein